MIGRYVNQAGWERGVRIGVGVGLLAAGWWAPAPSLWGIALKLFGWFPLVTGLVGWCPLYAVFGITTRRWRRRAAGPPGA